MTQGKKHDQGELVTCVVCGAKKPKRQTLYVVVNGKPARSCRSHRGTDEMHRISNFKNRIITKGK